MIEKKCDRFQKVFENIRTLIYLIFNYISYY